MFGGISNSIAEHVLHGATEQFTVAHHLAGEAAVDGDATAANHRSKGLEISAA
jgi:hypothetical protein